jgi:hypothetical protein
MGRNRDTVRAIEEAWNTGRLDDLDPYFAPSFDNSASMTPGLPPGLAGAKMAHQGVMQSFLDRAVEIQTVVEEGDRVVVRSRVTGTNKGGSPRSTYRPTTGRSRSNPGASTGSRTARWCSTAASTTR